MCGSPPHSMRAPAHFLDFFDWSTYSNARRSEATRARAGDRCNLNAIGWRFVRKSTVCQSPNFADKVTTMWDMLGTAADRLATIGAARNADGRLEAFGTARDNTIWHARQTSPGGSWSSWQMLGIPDDKLVSIAAARNADGRLEVFGTAPDDTIWHAWQTSPGGGWSAWQMLGTAADRLARMAAAVNSDGRLEAFGTAPDNTIWHAWQTSPGGGWSSWQMLGTAADRLARIAATENADGRLEAFGTAPDNTIWHAWQTSPGGGWSSWQMLGTAADRLATIGAARNADGRLEVFGTAPDNTIWHAWQTSAGGRWGGYSRLSKQIHRLVNLAATSNADGRLEAFGTAPDNTIWHTRQVSAGVWPVEPPDAPGAPWFEDVTDTSVTIRTRGLPDGASSLALEKRDASDRWVTQANNVSTHYAIQGLLQPSTTYTFRHVAQGIGGRTLGPSASFTTQARPTLVPTVVQLLLSDAEPVLTAARLRVGRVSNATGESQKQKLRVTQQQPSAGSRVPEGSGIDVTVALAQPPTGIKELYLYNCHSSQLAVHIWVYDYTTGLWEDKGNLNSQWDGNSCPAQTSQPFKVTFTSNRAYEVVATDCGANDPTLVSCRHWETRVIGDSNGVSLVSTIG
jgi:hypothetical protein